MHIRQWTTTALLTAILACSGAPAVLAKPAAPPAGHPSGKRQNRPSFDAAYVRDCSAFAPRERCELSGDLNADGKPDRVFKIKRLHSGEVGIAVAWADGRFSILGAGAPTPYLSTDVSSDGLKEEARAEPLDLEGIQTWRLLKPAHNGFASSSLKGQSTYAAPSVVGDGIYISGGDAAEMLYWDGRGWRRLILGF